MDESPKVFQQFSVGTAQPGENSWSTFFNHKWKMERGIVMELFALWWPVALVVGADVIYQVCAKKLSSHASPMAALGVTYIASAIVCAVLFEIMVPGKSIFAELLLVQPAAIVVGAAIAGLEVGSIYMYRAGWPMNVGFIVYTASIVVVLAIVGSVFYGDSMSWMRLAGILLTLTGMF